MLEQLIIYKLFVLRENIVFTAHQYQTAQSIFERLLEVIDENPSLYNRVSKRLNSQGKGVIKLYHDDSGRSGKVTFMTRSKNSGRGLDQVDTIFYDESYDLTYAEKSALSPTQNAAKNPQTIYVSSAVNMEEHQHGKVLSELRERGLEKEDGLFFQEFMADEEKDWRDVETWIEANPSFGVIHTEKKMKLDLSMGETYFGVEHLGWGRWFRSKTNNVEPVIPIDDWTKLAKPIPKITGDSALAIDVSPFGETVSFVLAYRCKDGIYLSLSPRVEFDRQKLVKEIEGMVKQVDPVCVLLDPKTQASTLIHDIQDLRC